MRSQIVKKRSSSSVEMNSVNNRSNVNENRTRKSPKTSGRTVKQVKRKTPTKFLLPSRAIDTFSQYFLRSSAKENKTKNSAEDILSLPFHEVASGKKSVPIDCLKQQSKNTKINKKYKLLGKTPIRSVAQSNMCGLKQS